MPSDSTHTPSDRATPEEGWIGVDLDGTLAHYDEWRGPTHIGAPIPKMVERVKKWVAEGKDVRLFTARWNCPLDSRETQLKVEESLNRWMEKHLGVILQITQSKDYQMIELWDDRAVQVEKNTGVAVMDLCCFSTTNMDWCDNHER